MLEEVANVMKGKRIRKKDRECWNGRGSRRSNLFFLLVVSIQNNVPVRPLHPSQCDDLPPTYCPSDIVYTSYNTIDYTPMLFFTSREFKHTNYNRMLLVQRRMHERL